MKSWHAALVLLGGLSAGDAGAANWVKVVDGGASGIFVDTSSINRTGDIVAAWYRRDFKRPMLTDQTRQPYRSAKVLSYYNCVSREIAAAQWITYENTAALGKIVSNEKANSLVYGDIPRGEAGEAIFNFVCKYVKQNKNRPGS